MRSAEVIQHEQALVAACNADQPEGWQQLYAEYYHRIFGFVLSRLRGSDRYHRADEITSELLESVWKMKRLRRFQAEQRSLFGYLAQLAWYRLGTLARRARTLRRPKVVSLADGPAAAPATLPVPERGQLDELLQGIPREYAQFCLELLGRAASTEPARSDASRWQWTHRLWVMARAFLGLSPERGKRQAG